VTGRVIASSQSLGRTALTDSNTDSMRGLRRPLRTAFSCASKSPGARPRRTPKVAASLVGTVFSIAVITSTTKSASAPSGSGSHLPEPLDALHMEVGKVLLDHHPEIHPGDNLPTSTETTLPGNVQPSRCRHQCGQADQNEHHS